MKDFSAYSLSNWPRRRNGELIFTSTNEAIYYANIIVDRLASYDLLKKWRRNAYQNINHLRSNGDKNLNRVFALAARTHFYTEAMEEIQRLNKGEL